ncbi:MAG: phosphoribosyl-AMP cyclohydrolase [Nitrospirota bacterium]
MKIPDLKFDKNGLIPAIIQDESNKDVLMMAYMNMESLEKTIASGFTHFWSRSRNKIWKKGETSGHVQEVKSIICDCDKDTLLIRVIQKGPGACHTGHRSCFFTDIEGKETEKKVFSEEEVYGKKNDT